jgi:starch-binding outer membrane protein, SusD/RagB family
MAIAVLLLGACNEDSFLKETPLDFMSATNSYATASDFDQAINELYYLTRYEYYCNQERSAQDYFMGTDILINGSSGNSNPNLSSAYGASGSIAPAHWDKLYLLVAQSNTVISRLPSSEISSNNQVLYEAKAKFFRGLAYRTLVYFYGNKTLDLGVPMPLEEVTTPKTDYVRESYSNVLAQAISDVKFAAENLLKIDDNSLKNGEVNSAAAYHLLAELYLATEQYQNAVDAASKVINNECGTVALMTSRFGSKSTVTPGDVYWDLYRMNNQNRSAKNTEGLWVIQMEFTGTTAGGTDITSLWSSPGSYLLQRMCAPQTGSYVRIIKNGTTYSPFTWPIGDYTGGRGIGSCIPTYHFDKEVWGGYGSTEFKQDIRNANHNMVRKFKFNTINPTTNLTAWRADFNTDTIDIDKYDEYVAAGWSFLTGDNNVTTKFPARGLMCYQTKCTPLYDEYPSALIANTTTYQLNGTAGGTYSDQYMFRLAETYLLRAEAYARLGSYSSALADINVVRNRANAVPATLAEVSATGVSGVAGLDYVLDERIRELGIEEKRRLTLGRLGEDIFYNRVTAYNLYYSDPNNEYDEDGSRGAITFLKAYTRYAIPQSAIDANKDAVLEQNSGY